MNYFIYGYKGDKKKMLGRYNSYWNAVCCKEAARKSGEYDKVILDEPAGKNKKQIDLELGLTRR